MQDMLAFENPWHMLALLGGITALRAGISRMRFLDRTRTATLEFVDSGLVAVLLVFFILRPFVVQAFYIPSGSMEPTLLPGDRILVSKYSYYLGEPGVGDVVVFEAPPQASPEEKDFIKRVVGVPGDILEPRDGKLCRNGEPVDEPYIRGPVPSYWSGLPPPYKVPPGYVVVFGDNRGNSNDGHKWGPLSRVNLMGKALVVFWPPHRIGVVR